MESGYDLLVYAIGDSNEATMTCIIGHTNVLFYTSTSLRLSLSLSLSHTHIHTYVCIYVLQSSD